MNDENKKVERLKENNLAKLETHNFPLVSTIDMSEITFTGEILGRGSFGEVSVGVWLKKRYATKCIDFVNVRERLLIREISILAALSHNNIIRVTAICILRPMVYILLELFEGKSLKEVLFNQSVKVKFNLNEPNKNMIVSQICQALIYIHYKLVLHRDIKPANILLDTAMRVKICDFGMSKISTLSADLLTTNGKKHAPGTVMYMAPEVLLSFEETSQNSDIWALGCTLNEVYKEQLTWIEYLQDDTMHNVLRKRIIPDFSKVPEYLQATLRNCLAYDPNLRPTAEMIFNYLPITD